MLDGINVMVFKIKGKAEYQGEPVPKEKDLRERLIAFFIEWGFENDLGSSYCFCPPLPVRTISARRKSASENPLVEAVEPPLPGASWQRRVELKLWLKSLKKTIYVSEPSVATMPMECH